MASIELEPSIKQALRNLHSSSRDSTEQVRLLLDEVIRHAYGTSKTMANVLPKKYLAEERSDNNYQNKKQKGESGLKSSTLKTVPVPTQSPQQIQIPERPEDEDSSMMDNELAFELLEEDLTCAVCRQIAVQAGNRLVECDACHALYHQDCHKPVISESDMVSEWQCASCLIATHGFTLGSVSGSKSGSSTPVKSSPNKQVSASVKLTSASQSTPSKLVMPNINIISADKRLQIMKKKAAKQQENKRKHSK